MRKGSLGVSTCICIPYTIAYQNVTVWKFFLLTYSIFPVHISWMRHVEDNRKKERQGTGRDREKYGDGKR
jgi:hypothetical protein